MNIRTIISSIVLFIFCLLAGASFDSDGSISAWVWIMLVAFVLLVIVGVVNENYKEKERREKAQADREMRKKLEAEQAEKYQTWFNDYVTQYGQPDKSIIIKSNDINEVIHVHENTKSLYMHGKTYKFRDIISCTFSDNPTTIKGKVTATTKSKTGSTIGRAVVGDLVAGPAGAIIGGTTGKKTTEIHQENDRTYHDYTVIVNINSISTPIIRISTGDNGKLTNEIVGLMNVIIARK